MLGLAEASADDLRAFLGLFPILMLFFAVEPRLSLGRPAWSALQSTIVGLGVVASGLGTLLCVAALAFVNLRGAGEAVYVLAFTACTLAIASAIGIAWRRAGGNPAERELVQPSERYR